MSRPFDEARMCGADTAAHCAKQRPSKTRATPCKHLDGIHRCHYTKGWGTDHTGSGRCKRHGGVTASGHASAAKERARAALEQLGQPVGDGDPFELLSSAVKHAHGHLEATAALVREASTAARDVEADVQRAFDLAAASELYELAIRSAARVGKQAVDADVADRRAALDERTEGMLWRFLTGYRDAFVPTERQAEADAWATATLTQLAAEYEQPSGRVN